MVQQPPGPVGKISYDVELLIGAAPRFMVSDDVDHVHLHSSLGGRPVGEFRDARSLAPADVTVLHQLTDVGLAATDVSHDGRVIPATLHHQSVFGGRTGARGELEASERWLSGCWTKEKPRVRFRKSSLRDARRTARSQSYIKYQHHVSTVSNSRLAKSRNYPRWRRWFR